MSPPLLRATPGPPVAAAGRCARERPARQLRCADASLPQLPGPACGPQHPWDAQCAAPIRPARAVAPRPASASAPAPPWQLLRAPPAPAVHAASPDGRRPPCSERFKTEGNADRKAESCGMMPRADAEEKAKSESRSNAKRWNKPP